MARYLELIKVAALIERATRGPDARRRRCREVNEILAQVRHARAARDLRAVGARRLAARHRAATRAAAPRPIERRREPSLEPFIPRRGDGLMLSASDIETYRICPLKYKFARVFRIPQEPTIHQRFGIVVHQVLERFHTERRRRRSTRADASCSRSSWRRSASATRTTSCSSASGRSTALERYWERTDASRGRAGLVRAQLRLQARPAPAARARGPRRPPPRRPLRADRLQDRQGEDRAASCARTCSCRSTRWARASRGGSRPRRRATTTC